MNFKLLSIVALSIFGYSALANFEQVKGWYESGSMVSMEEVSEFHRAGRCISSSNQVTPSALVKWSYQNPLGPNYPRVLKVMAFNAPRSQRHIPDFFDSAENFKQSAPAFLVELQNMWGNLQVENSRSELVLTYYDGRWGQGTWYGIRKSGETYVMAFGGFTVSDKATYPETKEPAQTYCFYSIEHSLE